MKLTTRTTHPEPHSRFARVPAFGLAAVLAAAGLAVVPGTAQADTTPDQTFSTAGTYEVTVPDLAQSMTVAALGGAGAGGNDAAGGISSGGPGGSGTAGQTSIAITTQFGVRAVEPGDVLRVTVGALGGGGQGGDGDASGGNGGGATFVEDTSLSPPLVLLVAGGGGGGGGGSRAYFGYNGGAGGTDAAGHSAIGVWGQSYDAGGVNGACAYPGVSPGGPGGSAPAGSPIGVGGGGGGGAGSCGGGGGGAGLSAGWAGGGSGGGAGSSYAAGTASSFTAGSNHGDGSVTLSFQVAPTQAPAFTTPNCTYGSDDTSGFYQVHATGVPAPSISLLGAPDGFSLFPPSYGTNYATAPVWVAVPHDPGEYRMAVSATNSAGSTVQPLTFELGVTGPSFISAASATAQVGAPFSFDVQALACPPVDGYSLEELPTALNWLSIDAHGHLTGTPRADSAGTHTFTIAAGQPAGSAPFTQSFELTVTPAPLTVTTADPLPEGMAGAPYSAALTATGGTGPYTWALSPGSTLPDGLQLHPDGTVDGTPTGSGTTTVGVSVTDAGSPAQTATARLFLPILPKPVAAIAVLAPELPADQVGQPYAGQLHASGGSGALSWILAPGSSLPPGLTLAPSGAITGTPTTAGSPSVSFVVTDSGGPATASATYQLTVASAPTTTSLSSSADPALQRQPITLTARVTAAAGAPVPTGSVTFSDGATSLGTATLDHSGVATLTMPSLALGSHSLTATYAGDTADLGSTSAPLPEVVQRVTPTALTAQATSYVGASSAYRRLSPARQRAALHTVALATRQLARLTSRLSGTQKAALIKAYDEAIRAAQARHYLTAAQATALIREAAVL